MKADTLTREEFDQRLTEATERTRQERLTIEVENNQLRELIARYTVTLERLEAELALSRHSTLSDASQIRDTLKQLAKRSEAVAAAL